MVRQIFTVKPYTKLREPNVEVWCHSNAVPLLIKKTSTFLIKAVTDHGSNYQSKACNARYRG